MISMTELEAMRQDILSQPEDITHDNLVTFTTLLNEVLKAEGFTTIYPTANVNSAVHNNYTRLVVEGTNEDIAVYVSRHCGSLMQTLGYTDSNECTIQELVSTLREVLQDQVDIEYCKRCDNFHEDYEEAECITCLLDLEMKAGCTYRRIKGT